MESYEWISKTLQREEQLINDLTSIRSELHNRKRQADEVTDHITKHSDLYKGDAELTNVISRLHSVFMVEHDKAMRLIQEAYEGLQKDPQDFFILIDLRCALNKQDAPVKRMDSTLSAMDEVAILPYYENGSH